jgi:hypothetical protein
MGWCVVVLGSTTKEIFETYVEQVLSPALRLRRVVVTDSLAAHKGQRMQKPIWKRRSDHSSFGANLSGRSGLLRVLWLATIGSTFVTGVLLNQESGAPKN